MMVVQTTNNDRDCDFTLNYLVVGNWYVIMNFARNDGLIIIYSLII
jgi:hypothetical protein